MITGTKIQVIRIEKLCLLHKLMIEHYKIFQDIVVVYNDKNYFDK